MSAHYEVIGASFDLGAESQQGALAPKVLREHGLIPRLQALGVSVSDGGDVTCPNQGAVVLNSRLKYLPELLTFQAAFSERIRGCYRAGRLPLVIGGDHSISLGSIGGAVEALRAAEGPSAELGVLWVDAHGDINTAETTPSGNIHGMVLACLLGFGEPGLVQQFGFAPKVKPENVVYIGLRDLDPPEKEVIRRLGIKAFTMKDVDLTGIGAVTERALAHLHERTSKFVVSLDLDVCDPVFAPGVGTPVRGGLTFRETHLILELVAEQEKHLTTEIVEYNPAFDKDGITAEVAISFFESALGKRIL